LVYVWQFAARGTARDIIFVVADLDAAPGVFVVGIRTSDDQIGAESSSRKTWGSFDLGHLTLNIADAGKVDEV